MGTGTLVGVVVVEFFLYDLLVVFLFFLLLLAVLLVGSAGGRRVASVGAVRDELGLGLGVGYGYGGMEGGGEGLVVLGVHVCALWVSVVGSGLIC